MKKIYAIVLVIATLLITVSIYPIKVNARSDEPNSQEFYSETIESFGKGVYVDIYIDADDPLSKNRTEYFKKAKEILGSLSSLSDNFYGFTSGPYKNNVYYINNNPGKEIEIDQRLYEIIEYSLYLTEFTDGYFDITIGKIIDAWKDIIENDYTTEVIDQKIKQVEEIEVIRDEPITLRKDTVNKKFYITIKEGVKIDLGGIAKGYGVQKVYDYFKSEGLTYFHIKGSASSLSYGERNTESKKYRIRLSNPYFLHELTLADKLLQLIDPENYPPRDKDIYGTIEVSNTSLTTSGDTEQSKRHGKLIIHHIISPKTKKPENYYRMVTLEHPDAGYSDAMSTAMFSMDPDTLDNFMKKIDNQSDKKLSGYITFGFDMKINDKLSNGFEKWEDSNMKTTSRQIIIILAVVVIVAGGLYMLSSAYKNKIFDSAVIYYNNEEVARINFDKELVTINVQKDTILEDGLDSYPIHNQEEQTITILSYPQKRIKGQEEFEKVDLNDGRVRYELVIKYNMVNRSVEVIQEICPDKIAMSHGEVSGLGISCAPARVSITFPSLKPGDNDFDGEI